MAQQTVESGDFHLVSSVLGHHCRQMAFIKLLSFIFHLDPCPLLIWRNPWVNARLSHCESLYLLGIYGSFPEVGGTRLSSS